MNDQGNNASNNPEAEEVLKVEAVAIAYRRVVVWFGVANLVYLAGMGITSSFGEDSAAGAVAGMATMCLCLVGEVFMLVNVYRLAARMESKAAWAWVVIMFFPCLNLLFLLILSSNANRWLTEREVRVGLLGPNRKSIQALKARRLAHEPQPPDQTGRS